MDTRRFRRHSQSVAAFRWLGWVMLMMFVLVQAVQATAADARKLPHAGPHSGVLYEEDVRQPLEDVRAIDGPVSIGVLLEGGR